MMLRQVTCTIICFNLRALVLIFKLEQFFLSHSFLANGMPFPFVSRIVVNVSAPHVRRIRLSAVFFVLFFTAVGVS